MKRTSYWIDFNFNIWGEDNLRIVQEKPLHQKNVLLVVNFDVVELSVLTQLKKLLQSVVNVIKKMLEEFLWSKPDELGIDNVYLFNRMELPHM